MVRYILFLYWMALKVASAFDKMAPYLRDHGAEAVKKVGFVYHF
jgi:hypothetical protein